MAIESVKNEKTISCNANDLAITILRLQVRGYVIISVESKFFTTRFYEVHFGKLK